jgi:hypothetical protein
MNQPASLYDRFLTRKHPAWVILVTSLALLLLPFGLAYADDAIQEMLPNWRIVLLSPVIVLYIWLVAPYLDRVGADVIHSIQSIVDLDEENFKEIVRKASYINPRHEMLFFAGGIILGLVTAYGSGFGETSPLLRVYLFVMNALMYGLLSWTIFVSVASTRVNAALHRLPLKVDLFDQAPFQAVGRQSLLLALVFIGGISISIFFTLQVQDLSSPEVWLYNLPMILVTLLIFFLSMRPTHRVLAAEKKRQLEPVRRHIQRLCRELVHSLDQNHDSAMLPAEINALVLYEQRLQNVRSWPYNTAMLRALFFSVLVPLGTVLVRAAAEKFFLK